MQTVRDFYAKDNSWLLKPIRQTKTQKRNPRTTATSVKIRQKCPSWKYVRGITIGSQISTKAHGNVKYEEMQHRRRRLPRARSAITGLVSTPKAPLEARLKSSLPEASCAKIEKDLPRTNYSIRQNMAIF
jgi:hypothetical protein